MNAGKYKDKYRIASARLPGWEYGRNAAYFITICTRNRIHVIGEVVQDQVILSPLGLAATECWRAIPEHFPFVRLDVFVIMPDHVHGIVIIDKPTTTSPFAMQESKNDFGPQKQNLASIVRGFKIGVTQEARRRKISFGWQPRYHDRIIRNAAEFDRIRQYILENPKNWAEDCNSGEYDRGSWQERHKRV